MGSGEWSAATYAGVRHSTLAAGKSTMGYTDDDLRHKPKAAWTAHADLDPKGVALRESRDSDEHPTSLAIAVLFDVTGSMGGVPRVLQEKLPELFGLLLRKGYVEHPQILFGAIGDANWDRIPLQMGQFESDNRLDENLANIALEGGGGGGGQESYELALYFMAHHTATDCFDKRGHRGYLFIIGDEMAYDRVDPKQVSGILGEELSESVDTAALMKAVQEKYDVYFICPAGTSHRGASWLGEFWRGMLGQQFIELDDLDAVTETIALSIGLGEGTVDLDEGMDHLAEIGSTHAATVGKALSTVGSKGAVSESDAPSDLDSSDADGAARL